MSKPRLLDLFCGAGGAAMGYHRAGFEVVGVDIDANALQHYPFECVRADIAAWMSIDANYIRGLDIQEFDAIHASPPCQRYIRSGNVDRGRHPDLLGPTRDLLEQTGLPWVIENVPGAPMRADAVLCGSQFGLAIKRHRWFEFSWKQPIFAMGCDHSRPITGVYGNAHGAGGASSGMLPGDLETWSREMGIDWMTTAALSQAIPPAYTELIGHQLMQHIQAEVVA